MVDNTLNLPFCIGYECILVIIQALLDSLRVDKTFVNKTYQPGNARNNLLLIFDQNVTWNGSNCLKMVLDICRVYNKVERKLVSVS